MSPKRVLAALLLVAAVAAVAASADTRRPSHRPPAVDTESPRFTLAVVPDTQGLYGWEAGDSQPLDDALRWIAEHRSEQNIAFTAALGDVTQDGTDEELDRAGRSYEILDRARVPYSMLAGNHDIDSGTDDQRGPSPYLRVFGPQRFDDMPTWRGASPDGYNHAHAFRAAGREWLVLALDWRLSDRGVAWAQSVLDAHPRTPTIVTTHELVHADAGEAQLSDYGRTLWDRLIRRNDQVFLTINGHFWPNGRMLLQNDFGHDVQLGLANYQDLPYGGAATIRTYAFDLARNTIDVSSFSPYVLGQEPADRDPLEQQMAERTGPQDRFSIPIDFEERFGSFDPKPPPEPVETEELLLPGTVALWRPEGGERVRDASGHGNDLSAVTLPGTPPGSLTLTGEHAPEQPTHASLRFTGAKNPARGTYLRTADGAPLNRMEFRDGYTIEAFLRLPPDCCEQHAWMGLVAQMGTGADAGKTESDPLEGILGLNLSGGAELQFAVWPTNWGGIATNWSHQLRDETWTHVAVVNDGRFMHMYVDGSLVAFNPFEPAIGLTSTGKHWMLGATNYDNVIEQTFDGWIGDVRIVDRPLAVDDFMRARGPRVAARAGAARVDHRTVAIPLGGEPARGAARAALRVPRTGLRIELGAQSYRTGTTLRYRLGRDEERALRVAGADGARIDLRLTEGEVVSRALVSLHAR